MRDFFSSVLDQISEIEMLTADSPKQIRVTHFCPNGSLFSVELPFDHPRAPGREILISPNDFENIKIQAAELAEKYGSSSSYQVPEAMLAGIPVVTE